MSMLPDISLSDSKALRYVSFRARQSLNSNITVWLRCFSGASQRLNICDLGNQGLLRRGPPNANLIYYLQFFIVKIIYKNLLINLTRDVYRENHCSKLED